MARRKRMPKGKNTLKYVPEKDRKALAADLKSIYQAPTEEQEWENTEAIT